MTILDSGYVGIGTAVPERLLHLKTTDANMIRLDRSGSENINSLFSLGVSYTAQNDDFLFLGRDGSNNDLVITDDGLVGIGTTSPTHKLNVVGNMNLTGNLTVGGGALFKGAILGDTSFGYKNIRFGVYYDTPRIIFDNGSLISQIDYVGDNLRFIFNETGVGNRVTMRINNSAVKIGEAGRRRNLYLYGDLIGVDPAGGGSNINIDGDIDMTGNFTGNQIYGGMWYHNHTGTTLAFEDTVWYPLYFTNATHLNGFDFVGGFGLSSNLTANIAGTYQANYMGIGSGQNNHVYITSILINGVDVPNCHSHKKMTAGGDVVTMAGICIITLEVGDDVQVGTMDYGGTGTGDYYGGNLNLVRIGN